VVSRILAFRPATVVARLAPRSDACPLSARELLGPGPELRLVLPIVRAPCAAIARAVLVAAKELNAVVGLALPAGEVPEAWFAEVTSAADELAAGLPILLSGEVVVGGEGAMEVARASRQAWRLAQAGLTHLALDVSAVGAAERGRILCELGRAGAEHGICVEAIVPLGDGSQLGRHAAVMLEQAAATDVVGVRCHAPADAAEARLQAAALARTCQVLTGTPLWRRGPVTAALLELLRGSPVRACEDGGSVAALAVGSIPQDGGEVSPARTGADLPGDGADRLEARAYVEAVDMMERLGASGSAVAVARALERRLEDR
jgi:hypothetical protein